MNEVRDPFSTTRQWRQTADPPLAPLRRSSGGAFTPILPWLYCGDLRLAPLRRSRFGSIAAVADTSQLPVDQWHAYLGDPTLADAILDRLVHNSYRLKLDGDSMRKRHTKPPAAAPAD